MSSAAFITVSARRTLGAVSVPPPPLPTPAQASPKKIEWPPSVREYVQRCFASENRIPGISSEDMQARLKLVINDAANNNQLHILNWAQVPLPQQMIQIEQAQHSAHLRSPTGSSTFSNMQISESSNTNKENPKKRKSAGLEHADDASLPPWRSVNPQHSLESRISKPKQSKQSEKRQKKFQEDSSKSNDALEKRRQRFGLDQSKSASSRDDSPGFSNGPVVGTCQDLKKRYFRLTAAPKPELVRPLPVLRQTLELLKDTWRKDNQYPWVCDQFKSMRQDLTVQHIKNEFTVTVYEIHARIALEQGDLGEYNQCQTVLRSLYKQKLGGHRTEFMAYRILYFLYTQNRTGMNDVLADLTPADRKEPGVAHALRTRSALASGNYHRFFKLYMDMPNMGSYLVDMFMSRERLAALAIICRTYKQEVDIRFITEELAFESDVQCCQFVCDHGGQHLLQEATNGSGVRLAAAKAGLLFERTKQVST